MSEANSSPEQQSNAVVTGVEAPEAPVEVVEPHTSETAPAEASPATPAVDTAETPAAAEVAYDRDALLKEIGQTLLAARQAQHISLEEISSRLKVTASKLQAIEAGSIAPLPDFTFAKGVMRSYAKTLKIDIDGLLSQLRQHAPASTVGLKSEEGLGAAYQAPSLLKRLDGKKTFKLVAVVGLVVLAVAVIYALKTMQRGSADNAPAAASQASAAVVPNTASAASGAEAGMTQTALPPLNLPAAPASSAAPAAASAATPTAAPATAAPAAPTTAPAVPASGASSVQQGALRVRFTKDSWFEVRDGAGKTLIATTAKSGTEQVMNGTPPLQVKIGNVSAVEAIDYQGGKVDLQAYAGKNVARLTLPTTAEGSAQ